MRRHPTCCIKHKLPYSCILIQNYKKRLGNIPILHKLEIICFKIIILRIRNSQQNMRTTSKRQDIDGEINRDYTRTDKRICHNYRSQTFFEAVLKH